MALGVAVFQAPDEALPAPPAQPLAGPQQGTADPVQGIAGAAPVAQGLLLDPPAGVVDGGVGQVGSDRGAVSAFRLVRLPGPSPEPDVRLPPHPALHEPVPLGYAAPVVTPLHGVAMAAPR